MAPIDTKKGRRTQETRKPSPRHTRMRILAPHHGIKAHPTTHEGDGTSGPDVTRSLRLKPARFRSLLASGPGEILAASPRQETSKTQAKFLRYRIGTLSLESFKDTVGWGPSGTYSTSPGSSVDGSLALCHLNNFLPGSSSRPQVMGLDSDNVHSLTVST